MNSQPAEKNPSSTVLYLTEIIGAKIISGGENVGKLVDMIIVEKGMPLPHITHLIVRQPFGEATLIIPITTVTGISRKRIVAELESLERYEGVPARDDMLIIDYVLNKKVINMSKREVARVHDVKILRVSSLRNMYVTDVDFSRCGTLRKYGLSWLIDLFKIKEDTISWTHVQPLPPNMAHFKGNVKINALQEKLNEIPPADMADILEDLHHEQRQIFFKELDTDAAAETFEELEPDVQREMVSSMDKESLVFILGKMTQGQVADVLAHLDADERSRLLNMLEPEQAKKITAILDQQEQSIVNYCTAQILTCNLEKPASEVKDNFQTMAKNKDVIMYLYVVDQHERLAGVIDLKELLMSDDNVKMKDIMTESVISLNEQSTMKDAVEMFARYGFRAIPVVDGSNRIIGVLQYKDTIKLQQRGIE